MNFMKYSGIPHRLPCYISTYLRLYEINQTIGCCRLWDNSGYSSQTFCLITLATNEYYYKPHEHLEFLRKFKNQYIFY